MSTILEERRGVDLEQSTLNRVTTLLGVGMPGGLFPTETSFHLSLGPVPMLGKIPQLGNRTLSMNTTPLYAHVGLLNPGYRQTNDEWWFQYRPGSSYLYAASHQDIVDGNTLHHINFMLDVVDRGLRAQTPEVIRGQMDRLFGEIVGVDKSSHPKTGKRIITVKAFSPGYHTRDITASYGPKEELEDLEIGQENRGPSEQTQEELANTSWAAHFFPHYTGHSKVVELTTVVNGTHGQSVNTWNLDQRVNPDLRALHAANTMIGMLKGSIETHRSLFPPTDSRG